MTLLLLYSRTPISAIASTFGLFNNPGSNFAILGTTILFISAEGCHPNILTLFNEINYRNTYIWNKTHSLYYKQLNKIPPTVSSFHLWHLCVSPMIQSVSYHIAYSAGILCGLSHQIFQNFTKILQANTCLKFPPHHCHRFIQSQ